MVQFETTSQPRKQAHVKTHRIAVAVILFGSFVAAFSLNAFATVLPQSHGVCTPLQASGSAPPASACDAACPGDTCADKCNGITYIAASCGGVEIECTFEVVSRPTKICRHCPCNHVNPQDPTTWRCTSYGLPYRTAYEDFTDCFN